MQHHKYHRLMDCEREEISRMLAAGVRQADMARALGRNPSTISREIRGNSGISGYRAFSACRRAARRSSSRRDGKNRLAQEHRLRRYDQGKEMSGHKQFTVDSKMQVYFAHPASPGERGTNENTNGLIRQYFPKGTDFTKIPMRLIKRVQRRLNDRPRAVLDYEKPDEVINRLVALKV